MNFIKIPFLTDQKYERYLPTGFSDNLTLLQKVNTVLDYLNQVIESINNVSDYVSETSKEQDSKIQTLRDEFEALKEWLENAGLSDHVVNILNEWFDNGKLAQLINDEVFSMKASQSDVNDIAYNVKVFGAVGDGVTDDTQSFQDCADAIAIVGGGKMVVPNTPNGYSIKGTVNLPGNMTLSGNGSLILANTSDNAQTPFKWSDKNNVTVENLKIDGFRQLKNHELSVTGGSYGLYFHGDCQHIRVSGCEIYNTLEHCISISGYIVLNSETSKHEIKRVRNVVIENNTFRNFGNPNYGLGPRGAGIMCYYGSSKVKVVNNHFIDFAQNCIYLDSSYADRETLNNSFPALSVENGDYMGYDNQVIGNTFEITFDHGMFKPDVSGCGVVAHGQSRCIISNNDFYLPYGQYYAVQVSGGQEHSPTKDVMIMNNYMLSSFVPVRVFQSERVFIKHNHIEKTEDNQNHAIYLWYAGSPLSWDETKKIKTRFIEIVDNVIISPVRSGIYIRNQGGLGAVENILVRENSFYVTDKVSGFSAGLMTEGSINKLHIISNRFFGGYYGVYVGNTSENVRVKDNFVDGSDRGLVIAGKAIVIDNETINTTIEGTQITHSESESYFNLGTVKVNDIKSFLGIENGELRIANLTANTWNKNPLRLGSYYMWVNGLGQLMMKYGKPTHDKDGTIIGTV